MATSSILKDYHATPERFDWLVNFIDENYSADSETVDTSCIEEGVTLLKQSLSRSKTLSNMEE